MLTVAAVIEQLKALPPDAQFGLRDPDTAWWAPNPVITYEPEHHRVEITAEYHEMTPGE